MDIRLIDWLKVVVSKKLVLVKWCNLFPVHSEPNSTQAKTQKASSFLLDKHVDEWHFLCADYIHGGIINLTFDNSNWIKCKINQWRVIILADNWRKFASFLENLAEYVFSVSLVCIHLIIFVLINTKSTDPTIIGVHPFSSENPFLTFSVGFC